MPATCSNLLLQVLDDGRLTDAQERQVDCRNTVVIMTSNIGSHYLLDGVTADGEITPDARGKVMAELRGHFRPEFLNRVGDIVLFTPLVLPQIERIVDLQLQGLRNRLAERQIQLEITTEAERLIAEPGYDPVYGARPLRRHIALEVEIRVGRALRSGEITAGGKIEVSVDNGEPAVGYSEPARAA